MVSSVLPDRFVHLRPSVAILDPACGDGAFIVPLLNRLAEQLCVTNDSLARLSIVRDHVYGVDSDPEAIHRVRQRVSEWIGSLASSQDVERVLASHFPCGDALLGNDWTNSEHLPTVHDRQAIDWGESFPSVAAAGGFDLIIGNPPYRRERDSKSDFDRIAASTLGQWREPRMDLWHYFLHRGLDLLKPGGRLTFIVNSYWISATSAKRLRERVASETTLEEIMMLGAAPLFQGVSGQHMIFRLCKQIEPETACRVHDLSSLSQDQIKHSLSHEVVEPSTIPQSELWQGNQRQLQISASHPQATGPLLGDFYEVRQGIAENPPFVTRKAALELGDAQLAGRGVFVLTDHEVDRLQLNDDERALLRPYYALSAIERFQVAAKPTHQLLYLTRQTAPSLEQLPQLARHLEPFRAILNLRREVRSGQIAWWHLHWPREERLFTSPRILSLQMGATPRFAYAEQPTYIGFSMHVITSPATQKVQPSPSLPALTAILNSSRAQRWFESHAKHRGAHLDISGTILKQFPLPAHSQPNIENDLIRLTQSWPIEPDAEAELQLNQLVDRWYGFST